MEKLLSVSANIEKLGLAMIDYKKTIFSTIDINDDDWIEKAKSQSDLFVEYFKASIDLLHDEMVKYIDHYTKKDILIILQSIEKYSDVLNVTANSKTIKSLDDIRKSSFILLLRSFSSDYKDCLMEWNGME